ncbi:PDR/VanB family oxidoreductase [Nocardia macrotermitis]|uniref:Phenoxybenzoate dioxygenase subunit beta n=1 Tax=Nocardia macrotermitis TaxID=2585198 RepID=A0A7K0CVY5_9NOCA|nr:PDR/VanB family oxidoreductase [Nocardia macrotermitis]MQY17142.1 Phenoxybenzoate dioxygenase subunit beta [Nocardia macrotermitis]
MTEFGVRVQARRDEAEGVFGLELAATDGTPLPAWSPGAHIDIGVGSYGVRQYSLCGDPADARCWRVAILREPAGRGGSEHLFRTALPGTELRVSLPRNNFELLERPSYVFVAGGIGITPLLPMVAAAAAAGADWTLYYGARSRAHLAFTAELARHGDRVTLVPQDRDGLLPIARIIGAAGAAAVYCCGPEPLLAAVEDAGRASDVPVHLERFAPKALSHTENRPFEVRLSGSGDTFRIGAGQSIADVLESAGIPIVTSCREGACGSCETPVLSGAVDHRDSVLTEAERERGDTMMLCVSRAHSQVLVLDL